MRNSIQIKSLFITSILATSLFSASINLELAEKNPQRVSPNSTNEILSFNSSIKEAMKAVVNISTKTHVKAKQGQLPPMFNDPMFKKFFGDQFGKQFGNQFPKNRIQRSLGSGVIISKDGYIVTNNHVVENADEISITLSGDKTEYTAKVIGVDAASDIAVIKIEKKDLPVIRFGYSNELQIADMIFAIGNPFGIGETVTQGIISALNKNRVGINQYENFIQTDASINPGNSGGALVDSRGALIGINSAILSKSGGNNGIGFAIPVSMVKDVVKKLITDGKVTRGYLGVSIDDLNKELSKVYNHKKGALVLNIEKDSAAQKFGLKRGDLIYEIEEKSVKDRTDLQNKIASFKPNSKIKMRVERDKKNITLNITLGSRDSLVKASKKDKEVLGGLTLKELNTKIKEQYRMPIELEGVLVTKIKDKSKSQKVGFQVGDVIIQIEDIEIKNFASINSAIKKYKNVHKRVYINRGGQTIILVIK